MEAHRWPLNGVRRWAGPHGPREMCREEGCRNVTADSIVDVDEMQLWEF